MPAHWTESEQHLLTILSVTTSTISLIASISVFTTIIASRFGYVLYGISINKLSFRLIAALVFSDSIRSIGNLIGSPNTDSTACKTQTFLKIYGSISSFLWMMVICWIIYCLLVSQSSNIQKYQYTFHLIWIISFISAIIPISTDYQWNTGGWCYIKESKDGILMQFFCDYFWCLLTWIFSLVLYIQMIRNSLALNENLQIISQVRYYPMIFFVCWLFAIIRRLLNSLGFSTPMYLVFLQILFTNLYGLCNAIVWGLTIYHHIETMKQNESTDKLQQNSNIQTTISDHFNIINNNNKLINAQDMKHDMRNNELIDIDLDEAHEPDE